MIKYFYFRIILTFCLFFLPRSDFAITKKSFDFIIGVNGDFKAALVSAARASSRFYIFFPDGEYNIGELTGDSNQMTTITKSDISFIGQSMAQTIIYNQAINESISTTATLYFKGANNIYMQDLTIRNKGIYDPSAPAGRFVALEDQGDKSIYKNVKLMSYQDTYYSKSTRTYWEDSEIHGFVDFICGYGDIFFNRCLLYLEQRSSVVIAAPATKTSWGYVFMDCTIDGESGDGYRLGRSWSNKPRCVYINTTMNLIPSPSAWGDPMNVVPDIFAEYGSKTNSGSLVDLSNRRTTYTKDGKTVTLNPVLSASEASQYTINNVLGGNDNWQPETYTKQMRAPVVSLSGSTLKWNDNDSVLCWMIFKNATFYKCVISNSCEITSGSGKYTVRAANEMGGLGSVSNSIDAAITQYNLTVSAAKDQGTVTPEGGSYSEGQNVTLTASPNAGWIFDHWGGDLSGKTNPITVNMNDDKSVTACFVEDNRQYFTVVTQATPGGSITQIPEGSKIVQNTKLTLIATSNNGWTFNKWSGDYTGTDSSYTISSLSNDLAVAATFMPVDLFAYEAEYAVLNNSVQENKNAGFSGNAYVNFDNKTGSSAELSVYVKNAGERGVSIIFSNGSGMARTMSVSVNGSEQISSIEFEATTNWTIWQPKGITLTFNKEYNTITLTSTDDQGGPNIDKLILDRDASAIVNTVNEIKTKLNFSSRNRILYIYAAESEMIKIRIFSLNGKMIFSKNINKIPETRKVELNLKGFRNGIYIIRAECDGIVKTGYTNLL